MIEVIQADITTLDVDAIVNAANPSLRGGGGVDGAIHRAAGPELARVAGAMAPCKTGDAVITPGFHLSAKWIIHTVGPIWEDGSHDEAVLLRQAYARSFALAVAQPGIRSIAFPAISTGVYGFPKELAAPIAIGVMREQESAFDRIVACVFDRENLGLYRQLLP
jgi:O-acetyl-ADP-ribose deacetylase